jgi:hypothetical protein
LSVPVKLFFDECLSHRLARLIEEVYLEEFEDSRVLHLQQLFERGERDGTWLQTLKNEGNWLVLTADRAKNPKREKLPLLCSQLQITHLSMTATLIQKGFKCQKHALLTLFPQIADYALLPPGTKIALGLRSFHQRLWPCLTIEGRPFDGWCLRNGIQLPHLRTPEA